MPKKLKTMILSALMILLLTMVGCDRTQPDSGNNEIHADHNGVQQLSVESGKIVDENGKAVQLTGMSSHGVLWYPEYTNANAMKTLKSYGANTFRVALYSDDTGGGYVQKKQETLQFAHMAIENAISMDMYVIVDWHVLQDRNPLTNQGSAMEFFEEIASRYGAYPNLIYEICNEPNEYTTWDDIYAYANAVIPVIRNHAPNAIVIVGTPNYSYSVEAVFDKPLEFDNVMYSFHFYAGQHNDYYIELFDRCEKENIPVFVSEWGINYGGNGEPALSDAERFVKVLNRRGISWMGWSLCNKDEVFSAIKPDCLKLSDWALEDLTDVGKLFFQSFR